MVSIENELKKIYENYSVAEEILRLTEEEFVALVEKYELKDDLLKEIASTTNTPGDSSVFDYAMATLN